jgi:hypothetical protein
MKSHLNSAGSLEWTHAHQLHNSAKGSPIYDNSMSPAQLGGYTSYDIDNSPSLTNIVAEKQVVDTITKSKGVRRSKQCRNKRVFSSIIDFQKKIASNSIEYTPKIAHSAEKISLKLLIDNIISDREKLLFVENILSEIGIEVDYENRKWSSLKMKEKSMLQRKQIRDLKKQEKLRDAEHHNQITKLMQRHRLEMEETINIYEDKLNEVIKASNYENIQQYKYEDNTLKPDIDNQRRTSSKTEKSCNTYPTDANSEEIKKEARSEEDIAVIIL